MPASFGRDTLKGPSKAEGDFNLESRSQSTPPIHPSGVLTLPLTMEQSFVVFAITGQWLRELAFSEADLQVLVRSHGIGRFPA